jgi:2-keto-4-pentenoate hydratase
MSTENLTSGQTATTPIDVNALASQLIQARRDRTPLNSLLSPGTEAGIGDAIRIQQEVVRRSVNGGDKVVGFKLGNIAKAMQTKFGVDQPDFGYLLHSYFRPENLRLDPEEFIAPYVELEPAFVLKRDLGGQHVTVADVISATDYVLPSLEIIDSRIKDWKIGLFETLADGGSVGAVMLSSQPRRLSEVNLSNMLGEVRIDGNVVAQGNTSAVYGNPVSAIVWLCRRIAEFGITFKAGDVIIPGSCLAAVAMTPNTRVTGSFAGWGEISFEYGNAP